MKKILLNLSGILLLFIIMPFAASAQTQLTSGVPVSESVSQGQWKYYQILSSATDTSIEVNITGLSADVDLYVRANTQPTSNSYDCRPYNEGTQTETCAYTNPGATTWYIGVNGYEAGSYTVTATITDGSGGGMQLTSGVSVSESVSQGQWKYYQITSSATDTSIEVNITGLSADVDLYVRADAQPTSNSYDCRPYNGGTLTETCAYTNSGATTWYIGVNGYEAGSYTVTATITDGAGGGMQLTSGVSVSESVSQGQWKYYQITSSAADTSIEVNITGLSADVDLYVRADAQPTSNSYDCRPYNGGTQTETCAYTNPGATTWYIGVNGYEAGSYTVTATITDGSGGGMQLTSGVSVSESVSQGQWKYYQITSSAADTSIEVNITGLSADVDLYVRADTVPTLHSYDCRPYNGGTQTETCAHTNSGATTWYIGVHGYEAGSYTVTATSEVINIFVTIGDSITEGSTDDEPSDDTSRDGRNTGGGFQPILNDLLTDHENGIPHNIINKGNSGDTSADGLAKIQSILAQHAEAQRFLVMYGTNDARPWDINPSGLGLSQGHSDYPGTFKDNMQRIVDAINNAGMEVVLAKAPITLGSGYNSGSYSDPDTGLRSVMVKEYNQVIDELVSDSQNNITVTPPDFYNYFKEIDSATGRPRYEDQYIDYLHPNGSGYQSMADVWFNALR